jgi:hypothetical protein
MTTQPLSTTLIPARTMLPATDFACPRIGSVPPKGQGMARKGAMLALDRHRVDIRWRRLNIVSPLARDSGGA